MGHISVSKKEPVIIEGGIDWTDFFDKYWLKRPVLYRKPFGKTLISEQELYHILIRYQKDLEAKKRREIVVYDSTRKSHMGMLNSARVSSELIKLLPNGDEQGLDEYFRLLMQKESFEEFCIYINEAHKDPFVWKIVRDQLKGILEFMSVPPGKVSSDFFIGNYEKTNFGAHRDPIDNMMFMLFGSRTMLMWSDEIWKGELGNPVDNRHIELDYDKFRSSAISFTLNPGDMLYWPHHYWHVGENYGNLSGSFNLDFPIAENDLLNDEVVKKSITDHIKEVGKDLFNELGHFDGKISSPEGKSDLLNRYMQYGKKIRAGIDSDKLENHLISNWLIKLSSYGMMHPITPRTTQFEEFDQFSVENGFPVLYKWTNQSLLISHSGHLINIRTAFEDFISVIDFINSGEVFTIEQVCSKFVSDSLPENVVSGFIKKLYSIHAISLHHKKNVLKI